MFAPGSAEIDPAYFDVLREIATTLRDLDVHVVVEGHADSDGTDEAKNWQISADRAIAVVQKLRSYRDLEDDGSYYLQGTRITGRAMGEFTPASLATGPNELNRRVEIVIRGDSIQALDAIKTLEQNSGGVYGR
jgi:chemotaxis protein MotB